MSHNFITETSVGEVQVSLEWNPNGKFYEMKINHVKEDVGKDELFRGNPANIHAFLSRLSARNITLPKKMIDELINNRRYNTRSPNVEHRMLNEIYVRSERL